MTNDLTKGTPAKLIFMFAIPFLIGNLFQQFYNMVDTIIVGRTLGVEALAAVGATGTLTWFAMGTIQGFTTGLSAVAAQYFGANDETGIRKCFAMSILVSFLFTAVMTAVMVIFAYPILEILNTPADIIKDSYSYIIWIYTGLAATNLTNLMSNMIRALGDSKTPLVFLVVGCLVNIVLDFVLIIYGKMGTGAAGLATAIAQLVSGILCVIYILRKLPQLHVSKQDFRIDAGIVKRLLKIGMPMAFLNMVLAVGGVVIQWVNNGLGTIYVATYSSANKIEQFLTQPILSFGSAVAVYAAQNYGACKFERIKKGVNQTIGMTFVISVLGTFVMFFFGKTFMMFVAGGENEEIIINGYYYLLINSAMTVFLIPLVIYKSVLQAIGSAVLPIFSGFVEVFARAGASILLTDAFGFIGLCFANPAAWFSGLIPIAYDYYRFLKKIFNHQLTNPQA